MGTFNVKGLNGFPLSTIGDALHDLVPFVQFKKDEKHPWRSVFRTLSNIYDEAFLRNLLTVCKKQLNHRLLRKS